MTIVLSSLVVFFECDKYHIERDLAQRLHAVCSDAFRDCNLRLAHRRCRAFLPAFAF
jgi:hypothetical protein